VRQLVTLDWLEDEKRLDPIVEKLRSWSLAVLRDARVRDVLHGVWLGHPLHPMLTDVPVGAWTSAAVLDLVPGSGKAPDRLIAVGAIAAVPTALAGITDWTALHEQQARVGLVHATANVSALTCYLLSLGARRKGHGVRGRALGFLGLATMLTGGALGGHLSFRLASGANHVEHVPHVVEPGWHDLGTLDDLPDGRPVVRDLDGTAVFVLRQGGDVTALADTCSHLSGPLHEGSLGSEDGEPCVTCPWHGSVFSLRDGSVVHGPATSPQPVFRSRVTAGRIEVMLEGAG
jgi:nitrite reductase/ring-hydroxylating ferredoxin subunit